MGMSHRGKLQSHTTLHQIEKNTQDFVVKREMEHPADPWKDHAQMLTRRLTSLLPARHLKGRLHLSCIYCAGRRPAVTCKCGREKVSKGVSTKRLRKKGEGIQLNVKG